MAPPKSKSTSKSTPPPQRQPKKQQSSTTTRCRCSLTGFLALVGILVGLLSPVVYYIEKNLESFYIFDREGLHELAQRGISAHPNDTAAIVNYIVAELHEKHTDHVNPKHDDPQEWFFNNAGGAMGGMYVIHASEFPNFPPKSPALPLLSLPAFPSLCLSLSYIYIYMRVYMYISISLTSRPARKIQASRSISSSSARRWAPRATRGGTRRTTTSTS